MLAAASKGARLNTKTVLSGLWQATARQITAALFGAAALWRGLGALARGRPAQAAPAAAPVPLPAKGKAVDWRFVFKRNAKHFAGCSGGDGEQRSCPFGVAAQNYVFGQQFAYASSDHCHVENRLQRDQTA